MNDSPETPDGHRWNLLQRKLQETRVTQAFELFRANGLEPILIKGLAAGLYYPPGRVRLSIDMDLAVSKKDFKRARTLAAHAPEGSAIDLHRELRHLDTVPWADLFENSRLIEIEGQTQAIRILRPEDHLRVLCVHWLTDGGSNKDRLWDIYFAVANRPDDFDWSRFLDTVSKRRRRWLICTIGLARHFLGLDLTGTPIDEEARELPEWLVKTVEKEWADDLRPAALEALVGDSEVFFAQFKKKLRINPIWATVQNEGSFDARTRVFYQIANFFRRIVPSIQRISESIRYRAS